MSDRNNDSEDPGEGPRSGRLDGLMPAEVAAALRAIGPVIETERTGALYRPLHAPAPYPGIHISRDIAYGEQPRQRLDLFTPKTAGADRQVLVFLSGGGFRGGSKHAQGSPFYDNVMRWAVAEGFVGVNVDYRLTPEFVYPSGVEDVSAVITWVQENVAASDGDPERIVLWGHSAGGAHVADFLAAKARAGEPSGIAAAVLLSAFFDLGAAVSPWAHYYGEDIALYPERSSLPGLLQSETPLMVVDAELDPPIFRAQADLLTTALRNAGKAPERLHLRGHSHLSEGYAVGTADTLLTAPLAAFIRRALAAAD